MKKISSLILAAGNSSRLGQEKQLITVNGETLLRRISKLACNLTPQTLCILGFNSKNIREEIKNLNIDIAINKNWPEGMGTSIAYGVEQLANDVDGILILLCDQWKINHTDLSQLILAWNKSPNKIIASCYFNEKEEILGAPCIFPKKHFVELSQLKETGAHHLLKKYNESIVTIELENAAFDLDTPEQLKQLPE